MKDEKDKILASWFKRKCICPTIQNETIKLMGLSMLWNIVVELQKAPFLAIMINESNDREQVTLFLRWVTDTLDVNEEFLGLYHVDSIEAASVAMVITDIFQRYGLYYMVNVTTALVLFQVAEAELPKELLISSLKPFLSTVMGMLFIYQLVIH